MVEKASEDLIFQNKGIATGYELFLSNYEKIKDDVKANVTVSTRMEAVDIISRIDIRMFFNIPCDRV